MQFNFFGLQINTVSKSSLMEKLLNQKFKSYSQNRTERLATGKINISYNSHPRVQDGQQITLSSTVQYQQNKLTIDHNYLTTSAEIVYKFVDKRLSNININYNSTLIFKVIDFFLSGNLERQLFQNIIGTYIEQALFHSVIAQSSTLALHASSVEKDGKVLIFAGLNGVGKSTLAQWLIHKDRYSFYSDNYLIVDRKHAYLSPDLIRLDQNSLQLLSLPAQLRSFGFNKFVVENSDFKYSTKPKAEVSAVYFVQRGDSWSLKALEKRQASRLIGHLQIVNTESINHSAVSQYTVLQDTEKVSNDQFPDCNYYLLTLGDMRGFSIEKLSL